MIVAALALHLIVPTAKRVGKNLMLREVNSKEEKESKAKKRSRKRKRRIKRRRRRKIRMKAMMANKKVKKVMRRRKRSIKRRRRIRRKKMMVNKNKRRRRSQKKKRIFSNRINDNTEKNRNYLIYKDHKISHFLRTKIFQTQMLYINVTAFLTCLK